MPGIIKADGTQSDTQAHQQVAFNFDDIQSKASAYLDEVRAQAGQIIQQANQDADQIRRDALAQGKQQGAQQAEDAAKGQVQASLQPLVSAIQQRVDALAGELDQWKKQWEENLLELAIRVAEQIIHTELKNRPQIAAEIVRQAIELATGSDEIKLSLHPADRELVAQHIEPLLEQIGRLAATTVVDDPAVGQGGCVINTQQGRIDYTVETRLNRILEELK